MSQQRLHHLMFMHVHKYHIDQLSLVDTANEFIRGHDHKEHLFGKFINSDLHVLHWKSLVIRLYAVHLRHCHLLKMALPLFNCF